MAVEPRPSCPPDRDPGRCAASVQRRGTGFFNVGFIINPDGEVILKHYKVSPLFPVEHSVRPHDIYDWWIEKYGRNLDAFWPVADTEIGQWDNWLKDLRTELYQLLYEQPIYPKNLYLEREPMKHAEYKKKVIEPQIKLLQDRGVWAKPAR